MQSLCSYSTKLPSLNLSHLSLSKQELTEDRAWSFAVAAHSIPLLGIVLLAWQILTSTMSVFKEEYHRRNFTEVLSPNMYNSKLWETSGHWQHYSNNMFTFDIEKDTFALKPMNCPGHW